eukprot:COSAG02_NODE_10063_length_2034_cov_2.365186_1_plen_114_part_10
MHGRTLVSARTHRRGTELRPLLIRQLGTELWDPSFSRSGALGHMLPASARALWPFLCVSARPARPAGSLACAAAGWSPLLALNHTPPVRVAPWVLVYILRFPSVQRNVYRRLGG